MNRAVGRHAFVRKDADDEAFELVIGEVLAMHPIRMLACCLMPNHWHFVLWPARIARRLGLMSALRPRGRPRTTPLATEN